MLYKFKSKVTADLIMLEPNGRKVLQLIGKGDAASLVKGILLPPDMPAAAAALERAIADEEAYHEVMLANFRAALPEAPDDPQLAQQMLRFFRRLGTRDLGTHFARRSSNSSCG